MAFLSILIPTFNRAAKLFRLLNNIEFELSSSKIGKEQLYVLVSNNASTDSTQEVLTSFKPRNFQLKIFQQKENIGIDSNMSFLYEQATTEYIWYFSDDDILLPGSISTVFNCLNLYHPDALLFSLMQPPGSRQRAFNFSEEIKVINKVSDMINLLALCPKISIYILKKVHFSDLDYEELKRFLGTDHYFIALSYSIIEKSMNPKLCVVSRQLVSCDSDYNKIRFSPETWGRHWVVFTHRYVNKHEPNLVQIQKCKSYLSYISFLWAFKVGSLDVSDPDLYEQAIKDLKIHFLWLIKEPRRVLQIILLKLHLAHLWPQVKTIFQWAKRLLKSS